MFKLFIIFIIINYCNAVHNCKDLIYLDGYYLIERKIKQLQMWLVVRLTMQEGIRKLWVAKMRYKANSLG